MYQEYLDRLTECLKAVQVYDREGKACSGYEEAVQKLVDTFLAVRKKEKKVFFAGNGGSAAIASHMTADFMKNGGMRTVSLYDSSVTTCMGNDYGYEYIFSRPLEILAQEGDLLVAVSSSGNSQNIVNAVHAARKKVLQVLTFSGFQRDNRIIHLGDYNIHVPVEHYGIVESVHNLILQQIADTICETARRMPSD